MTAKLNRSCRCYTSNCPVISAENLFGLPLLTVTSPCAGNTINLVLHDGSWCSLCKSLCNDCKKSQLKYTSIFCCLLKDNLVNSCCFASVM